MTDKQGYVYLIGAGPGDPGLMTIKGLDCLQRADVVIYDYLANPVFLKQASQAEHIYVGKRKGLHHYPQEKINQLLLEKANEGKVVARLKGGDPFVFGRGGEEAMVLAKACIPFEIVPGVTAAVAAAAYAGIPMTHRECTTTLGFVTGHEDPAKKLSSLDWDKLATAVGTLVFYMGIANLENICNQLIAHGRAPETPVAVVRWATTPRQETLTGTLADIAKSVRREEFKPPALIFVGEVVSYRESLRWFDNRPLFGKRSLVTRAATQAFEFGQQLQAAGAEPIYCPMIEIVPPESFVDLDHAIDRLDDTDFLILTSVNAVEAFFNRMADLDLDARALAGVKLVTVGPKTAEALTTFGLKPDMIPADYRAEGVIEMLRTSVGGKRLLYPRAELAREVIPRQLAEAGATVDDPVAYRSVVPEAAAETLHAALEAGIDLVTFSASSTVHNLVTLLDAEDLEMVRRIPAASIGPLTSKTAREAGLNVVAEPEESTLDAMLAAMVNYYRNQ
jgi:uroporphyrinogen III methyltransferase/synthase